MPQLFISNVPWNCHETELHEWFESKGFLVESIRLVRDLVTNASPAFAYVTLKDAQQHRKAIEATNGAKLNGSTLTVQEDRRSHTKTGRRRTDK